MRRIFCLVLLIWISNVHAHEPSGGQIHASLGPYIFSTDSLHNEFDSPATYGLGAIVNGDVDEHGGLEFSLFYMNKLFVVQQAGRQLRERGKRVQIGMGYRHWVTPEFSGSLAFFSSYSMGDPQPVRDDFAVGTAPQTSASDSTDYGFDISLQYEPFRKGKLGLVIDARYSWAVTEKAGEDENHLGVFVGIKYLVQSSEPVPDEEIF